MISILQTNLNNCRAAQDLLMQTELERKIGISIISEPYRIPADDVTWVANRTGTAAIHYNTQNVPSIGIIKKIGRYSVAVLWQDVLIISCYISPNSDMDTYEEFLDELEECMDTTESHVLIGGDFNSKSALWGNPLTDARGDRLSRWSACHNLNIVNVGTRPTCIRYQGNSIVDLTWCNPSLHRRIIGWTVLNDETLSDHVYILYILHRNETVHTINNNVHRRQKYTRWAYKKFDKDKFQEALIWSCTNRAPTRDAVMEARWAQEAVSNACDFSMPRAKSTRKNGVYWWSIEIADLRKASLSARRRWQKTKANPRRSLEDILECEESYRLSKKNLRDAIKKAKAKAWEDLIASIDRDPWGLPYKIVLQKLRRSNPCITEMMEPDTLNTTIERLFPTDPLWNHDTTIYNDNDEWKEEYEVSSDELCSALRRSAGATKAPGRDGIKAYFLKQMPETFLLRLRDIYTLCLRQGEFPKIWKQAILILIPKGEIDLNCPKVRPICLLNELGKILERVIDERLKDWMSTHPLANLAANQFGFRHKTSTCDALQVVKEFVMDARHDHDVVIGASLDITNAFNSIKWNNIRLALQERRFPEYLRKVIRSYLSDREIEYPGLGNTTIFRQVTAGVPQGSVLGPTLWNIAYDDILRTPLERNCVIIGYADDTLVLSRAPTVEEAKARINLQISKVLLRVHQLGLKIAPEKTGAILFNQRLLNPRLNPRLNDNMYRDLCSITVSREKIALQNKVKYLGLILDGDWKFAEHFLYVEQKVSKVIRALSGILPNLRGPSEKKRMLYAHTIASIINYGAPIWTEATGARKSNDLLRRLQRVTAIRVIAGYRTVSADAALLLARVIPTPLHASYFGRVFARVTDLKRNNAWNPLEEREVKKEEMLLLRRQWKLYLQRRDVAGLRTVTAILPSFDEWLDRRFGQLSFHMTQLLSGHGCFGTYLFRIGKADSPICTFCQEEEDSSEHTLQRCKEWEDERETLTSTIGEDLSLESVIREILLTEEKWQAFRTFAENVMSAKEEDERARERIAMGTP